MQCYYFVNNLLNAGSHWERHSYTSYCRISTAMYLAKWSIYAWNKNKQAVVLLTCKIFFSLSHAYSRPHFLISSLSLTVCTRNSVVCYLPFERSYFFLIYLHKSCPYFVYPRRHFLTTSFALDVTWSYYL